MDLAEAALHRFVVLRLREQAAHAAEDGRDRCAAAFDFLPEIRYRKALHDSHARADHDVRQDADTQRIHVEQRQWRDRDVLVRRRSGAQLQAREIAHVVVAEHAAFGRAGRARGVDDAGQIPGIRLERNRVVAQTAKFVERGYQCLCDRALLQCAFVQDQLYIGRARRDLDDALDVFRFTNHDTRSRVGNLMAQEFTAQGGIDRNADGAQLVDGEPADDGVNIIVEHAEHGLAGAHAELRERVCEPRREPVDIGIREQLAAKIEQDPIGMRRDCPVEGGDDGVLLAFRPSGWITDA